MQPLLGTYAGVVVNINDPKKLGRAKVRVPLVYGPTGQGPYSSVPDEDLPWAMPASLPLGGSAQSGGFSWLPNVSDRVYVRFLDGEPEKPIYEWAMQDTPQAEAYPIHHYGGNNPGGSITETTTGDSRANSAVAGVPASIPQPVAGQDTSHPLARVTYYWPGEDQFVTATGQVQTSVAGPSGQAIAQSGVTVAVDPSVIPYGSAVSIPGLASTAVGSGSFYAHDTGSAVVARTAAKGSAQNPAQANAPVIDVFVNSPAEAASVEAKLAQLYPGYNGYLPYSVTPPNPVSASPSTQASINPTQFSPGAEAGLKGADTSPGTAATTPSKRGALTRYGHMVEFNPLGIIASTATGYYLILQDGGTADPASGILILGTPDNFYLELDNEAEVLTVSVPHLQALTTSIRLTNLADTTIDTLDLTTLSKQDFFHQAERNGSIIVNGKLYLRSDKDLSVVANQNLSVIAQAVVGIQAPKINLGGLQGGSPNPIVRMTDLQAAVDLISSYLNTHVHGNGNNGAPTSPPIVPITAVVATGSKVVFENVSENADAPDTPPPQAPIIPVA